MARSVSFAGWKPDDLGPLLRSEAPPPKNWIVHSWLPAGFTVAIIAEEALGKSLIAYDLSLAIASGTPFLGLAISRPGRVLYFDEENPAEVIGERVHGLAKGRGLGAEIADNFHLFRFCLDSLWPREWAPRMKETVAHYGARLVVIDTLSCLYGPAPDPHFENDNARMKALLQRLARAILHDAAEPRSILLLHHTAKDPFTKGKPRGAGAVAGHVDAYYDLQKDGPEEGGLFPTVLRPGKKRLIEAAPVLGLKVQRDSDAAIRLIRKPHRQRSQ